MNELQEILKEEYEKQATITAAMLMEMVEEALGSFSSLVEGGEKKERGSKVEIRSTSPPGSD